MAVLVSDLSYFMQQLLVDVPTQLLHFLNDGKIYKSYLVSTSKKGVGEKKGSNQTPRGWHTIRAKIGKDLPINTIFIARRPQNEVYSSLLEKKFFEKDWVLTRILWLSGLEIGKNRLGDCDSMQRYIYIHGCPDPGPVGVPLSAGCIRMRNQDIVELFDIISVGTKVFIRGN